MSPMPPAIARLIDRHGLDARVDLDELVGEFELDNAELDHIAEVLGAPRQCEGCGCTDESACIDSETGAPCSWVENYEGGDICTFCARVYLAGFDENVNGNATEPLVTLATPHEAQQYIERTRALRMGAGA